MVEELRPSILITTGQAPVRAAELARVGSLGIRRVNFSTDDPWNPNHKSKWFLNALPYYDAVFTPRTSNLEEFKSAGVSEVHRTWFGYDPVHCIGHEPSEAEARDLASDVLFVGGADRDRIPYAEALIQSGLNVALYGGYWDRHASLRGASRGLADPETIRKATLSARAVVVMARRANRDGHTMRSLEAAATGAALLAEDTADHRLLYGEHGAAYFDTPASLVAAAEMLLDDEARRIRLATEVAKRIRARHHTYGDRLRELIA